MDLEEFTLANEFLEGRLGLTFPDHKREILESRLKPRLQELNLRSYLEYHVLLTYGTNGRSELRNLIRLITNNETYFFRETHQFDALFKSSIQTLKLSTAKPGALRFLCAGCSSGEEPYTLSIWIKENLYSIWGCDVEIDAFDIDEERVEMANKGTYGRSSMRMTSEDQLQKYFVARADGNWELKPSYRKGVTFSIGNIVDLATYQKPILYDALFCRNVLIYFSEASIHRALENFARCLRPGGILFLGHSESAIGLCPMLDPVRLGDCIAYRRVGN